ncbi:DUF805 domain-containing protein [Paenibacillus macerans]|uniref:DUF805 domain-containing protein n=1 Tax=Paenibacillus macerans TaxID=44252 RepID=UPI00203B93F1|nr:DUF805 domain-containing protein [Paenibacillus macerans]MCM3702821.1 DUF805 domain-containing protein [Paenibacillus macerans]
MQWYLNVLKNYVGFQGRARRKEFWMFALFNYIAVFVLVLVGSFIHSSVGMILGYIYMLAVLLPSLAVGVRRLHDIGKSGWMILLGLIPFVGPIIILVFNCLDSEPGDNQYGPNPKAFDPVHNTFAK